MSYEYDQCQNEDGGSLIQITNSEKGKNQFILLNILVSWLLILAI